jgi:hypothetical protein
MFKKNQQFNDSYFSIGEKLKEITNFKLLLNPEKANVLATKYKYEKSNNPLLLLKNF